MRLFENMKSVDEGLEQVANGVWRILGLFEEEKHLYEVQEELINLIRELTIAKKNHLMNEKERKEVVEFLKMLFGE